MRRRSDWLLSISAADPSGPRLDLGARVVQKINHVPWHINIGGKLTNVLCYCHEAPCILFGIIDYFADYLLT